MFYCDDCREKRDWPSSMSKSEGLCELCGNMAICNDVPSSRLPLATVPSRDRLAQATARPPVRIEISENFLELCGTGALVGAIMKENDFQWPQRVILVFFETSLAWRREHRGPRHYVIPEYSTHLLIEDVLMLKERGIEVEIQTEVRDPKK